ncbi:hypothetical protein [Elioraea rosea]|uniref:hypothetical protein n=1 Tax=Elioraea rosea TaxID=2492390 RepID=UPI0011828996|nr:hypothetical protein [Elioraea rosea]
MALPADPDPAGAPAKPGLVRRSGRWLRRTGIRVWRSARIAGGLAVLLVALLAALVVLDVGIERVTRVVDRHTRPTGGFISVESPEVYTRERLLNDRLDHAAWLDKQLLQMMQDDFAGKFRSVDALQTAEVLRRIGAQGTPDRQTLAAAEPTTLAVFEAMNEYREALRAERTQLLLDDRHDAEGNTLYLLSFDTTVVRARGEDRLGFIMLRIASPTAIGGWEARRRPAANTLVDLAAEDFARVYAQWIEQFGSAIDQVVAATAGAISTRQLQPAEEALLGRTLALSVCRALGPDARWPACRALAWRMGDPSAASEEGAQAPLAVSGAAMVQYWYGAMLAEAQRLVDDSVKRALMARRDDALVAMARVGFAVERNARGPVDRLEWIAGLMHSCSIRPQEPYEPVTVVELAQIEAHNGASDDLRGEPGLSARPRFEVPSFPCPPNDLQVSAAAALGLRAWLLANRRARETVRDGLAAAAENDLDGFARAKELGLACLRKAMAGQTNGDRSADCVGLPGIPLQRTYHVRTDACSATAFQQERLAPVMRRVPSIVSEDEEGTRPIVALHEIDLPASPWCRLVAEPVTPGHENRAAAALWNALNRDLDVFSYALVPRSLRERVSIRTGASDALSVAGDSGVGRLLAGLSLDETRSESLARQEGRLLVLGFGTPSRLRGGAAAPTARRTTRPGAMRDENAVVFGWLVRPRSAAEVAGGGDGQGSDHLKLQATISVPSWWRIVALEEVTCWVRPERLGTAFDAVRRGGAPHAADLWRAVAEGAGVEGCRVRPASLTLPGKVVDISARLGIAVEKQPHIFGKPPGQAEREPRHILQAGRRARLVIEGGRLWRNTIVTIGSQRANRISVLPDMQGIIAEFECLEPPLLARLPNTTERFSIFPPPHEGDVMAPVQLWTSEGKDEIPGGVLVRRFTPDEKAGIARPCYATQAETTAVRAP